MGEGQMDLSVAGVRGPSHARGGQEATTHHHPRALVRTPDPASAERPPAFSPLTNSGMAIERGQRQPSGGLNNDRTGPVVVIMSDD